MNKNTNLCNNCGKQGHMFHQCKLPIISYGTIVFKHSLEGLQFLMIRRKDSFGYIDFIRGKYSPHNLTQLITIIDEMSSSFSLNLFLVVMLYPTIYFVATKLTKNDILC